jgi:thiamine biosynthesis lipoprotein
MQKHLVIAAALLLQTLHTAAAASAPVPESFGGQTMGSTFQIQYVSRAQSASKAQLQKQTLEFLARFDAQISTWRADSDVARFNRAPAGHCQAMPQAAITMARAAQALAQRSGSAYSVTLGALLALHGFGAPPHPAQTPSRVQIETALRAAHHSNLELRADGKTLCKRTALALDFSSLAAGYAVDRVAAILEAGQVRDYLIEITGELKARGQKADATPWRIGIETPEQTATGEKLPIFMALALDNLASATSGDYRAWRETDDGKRQRISHTLDGRTGYPVSHALASVTVLHPQAMMADALSTLLMALGPQDALAWTNKNGIAALFIVRGAQGFDVSMSHAFSRMAAPARSP